MLKQGWLSGKALAFLPTIRTWVHIPIIILVMDYAKLSDKKPSIKPDRFTIKVSTSYENKFSSVEIRIGSGE